MEQETTEILTGTYEIAFLIAAPEAGEKVRSTLLRYQANITFQGAVNQVRLAYPIKKHESAFFGFIQFSAPREAVVKLQEEFNREDAVIRFMIIKPSEKNPEKPAPRAPAVSGAPEPKVAEPREAFTTNEALEKKLEEILK